jgi:peroxiredoxin
VVLGTDDHFGSGLHLRRSGGGVGAHAPDFELLSPDESHLKHLGKSVLINFYDLFHPAGMKCLLGVTPDGRPGSNPGCQYARDKEKYSFKEGLGMTFPILLDADGQVSRLYRIQGLPTTYIIDPDGIITAVHIGTISETQLNSYLEEIGLSND